MTGRFVLLTLAATFMVAACGSDDMDEKDPSATITSTNMNPLGGAQPAGGATAPLPPHVDESQAAQIAREQGGG